MNLFEHIKSILSANPKYCKGDQIFKNTIVEACLKLDPTLLNILINDNIAKSHFFVLVGDIPVFDKEKFQKFIANKAFLPDSYTAFRNKIGLTRNGHFIAQTNDVVLDFPFKDCILEGGQTKEDQSRKEIFWNETLAQTEIDRLLEPKLFTNWKRYNNNGEEEVVQITKEDNLIIKGNNLIAMHSLAKAYSKQIKLIYIDPPYNTGSDSFKYNDAFSQSTWLTFMKNRLDIAKQLLRPDGVIMVQCSFHQFAYLKVLMTDIFQKHLCDFHIQVRHPDRSLTGDKEYNDVIEYIIIFANSATTKMPFREELKTIDDYTYTIDTLGSKPNEILDCDGKKVEVYLPDQYTVSKVEPNKDLLKKISIRGSIREKNSSGRFFVKHLEPLSDYPPQTLFAVPDMGDDHQPYRYFYSAPKGNKNGGYYQGMPTSSNTTKKQYSNFYNFEREYNNVAKQGGVSFRNGKKPEELLQFLISIFTEENDIVLDYHLGSGTTAAVAHKLNRTYIGIEQMDYIKTISVPRLLNVINGDETGISKNIDWKGGGAFIYAELMEYAQIFITQISKATSKKSLKDIWEILQRHPSMDYRINPQKIEDYLSDFGKLNISEQKQFLISIIDKNQLYINLADRNDQSFDISENDIALNNQLYR